MPKPFTLNDLLKNGYPSDKAYVLVPGSTRWAVIVAFIAISKEKEPVFINSKISRPWICVDEGLPRIEPLV